MNNYWKIVHLVHSMNLGGGIKKPDAVKLYRAVLLYGGAVGVELMA